MGTEDLSHCFGRFGVVDVCVVEGSDKSLRLQCFGFVEK